MISHCGLAKANSTLEQTSTASRSRSRRILPLLLLLLLLLLLANSNVEALPVFAANRKANKRNDQNDIMRLRLFSHIGCPTMMAKNVCLAIARLPGGGGSALLRTSGRLDG